MKTPTTHLTRLPLALAVALAGCWVYKNDRSYKDGIEPDAGSLACEERRAEYPAGPYGQGEGDRLANLTFTDGDGNAVDLQVVRAECEPEAKVLVLTTSAGWCSACREEQASLQALHDAHRAAGARLIVTLFEDDDYVPADAEFAREWREYYDVTYRVWADTDFVLGDYYDRDQTPMVMLVDVESMQILKILNGFVYNTVESLLVSALN